MILSSPLVDHSPSTKLSSPDSVTCADSNQVVISIELDLARSSPSSRCFSSMVQSMSSTTRMDLLAIPTRSLLRSELQLTSVSSRSYMSNLRWLAMAAIRLDLPVPGGPYSSFWSMASVSNVDGWWRSTGDHDSEYSLMYILRVLSWSFMALAVATMNGRYDLSAFSLCLLWKLTSKERASR